MTLLNLLIIGTFSGLNAACWGLYKDSLYEKTYISKFFRSVAFSLGLTFLFYYFLEALNIRGYNLGVFFGAIVVLERLSTEIYKGFFRKESQRKYKIPVYFHVGKHVIKNFLVKEGIGVAVLLATFTFFYSLNLLTSGFKGNLFLGLAFGLLMGILEAMGGAEKDAPFEGFDYLKVYRSPVIHMLWGGIFSYFTDNYALLFLASGGLGRMTIEFYKTYVVKKVPGKFKAAKPAYPEWEHTRRIVILPYLITWVVFTCYLSA